MGIQVDSLFSGIQGYDRSFISFSYDGKNVNEFGFVVSSTSDGLTRPLYADFVDTTSETVGVNGQKFWLTTIKANSIDFELATDGIDERKIKALTEWLKPGEEKELILGEHPNRGIMARVKSTPSMEFVPFVNKEDGFPKTEYKGTVKVSFVMDYPFWHPINSYIDNTWAQMDNSTRKYVYEDEVLGKSYNTNENIILASSGNYANMATYNGNYTTDINAATTFINTSKYIYYCGTADERPVVREQVAYSITSQNRISYTNTSFSIGNVTTTHGLPDRFSSCIQTYNILDTFNAQTETVSLVDVKSKINENIKHKKIRALALSEIDDVIEAGGVFDANLISNIVTSLKTYVQSGSNYVLTIDSDQGDCYLTFDNGTATNTSREPAGNIMYTDYPVIKPTGREALDFDFANNAVSINVSNCTSINYTSSVNYSLTYKYKYY